MNSPLNFYTFTSLQVIGNLEIISPAQEMMMIPISSAPEINILPVPDIVSGSPHFVPVIHNSCRSSVYDILLKFENLPVIVTGRKRILLVTHEIVPDSDR